MSTVLLHGGHIYAIQDPFATSMLISDGRIAWIGDDGGAAIYAPDADEVVDLRQALVTPAFVDAHVHLTSSGLTINGLDLSRVESLGECLRMIEDAASTSTGMILGHGWDDASWPEQRPPTVAEIDARVGNRSVYLSRVDVHSALASSALRAQVPDGRGTDGWCDEGPLSRAAHHRVREAAFGSITSSQRGRAQVAALEAAAASGIASVHENAGPTISGADDLAEVLALGALAHMPEVVGYWGRLDGAQEALELGARGAAGDLFVDGSIGSRTACLTHAYIDAQPPTSGAAYLTADDVARHVIEATDAGIQAGFHVIGDGATSIVMEGLQRARAHVGDDALRSCRHRLEHLEMVTQAQMRELADLGVVASVQPAFDAAWGGDSGMYAQRLGALRAITLNPFGTMTAAGLMLAFGSDAPVTPLDPWGTVRAAAWHSNPLQRISVRAAFAAHTRGGRRAARDDQSQPAVLAVGAPATYAVWAPGPLTVQAPDGRVASWSTDPRSGTPPLPDLQEASPTCWQTVRDGVAIHDSGVLA
jgi:predicted amidohydrolase YtcJ